MGRGSVKAVGIAWTIIGLVLMVAGLGHQAEDIGDKMYYVGLALLILAIIVYVGGLLLKPSMGEILRAERFVEENRDRLQAYREGTGPASAVAEDRLN